MILTLFSIVATIVVAYVIYTIFTSYGSEYSDNSFDAFVIEAGSKEQGSCSISLLNLIAYFSFYEQFNL